MRQGFTLIELIFVIVIIGLLSAVAVPKFLKLKQNAQSANVIKVTVDSATQATEAAVNYLDMESYADVNLTPDSSTNTGLLSLSGKGWKCVDDAVSTTDECNYTDPQQTTAGLNVVEMNFSGTGRELNYSIHCNGFKDSQTQAKCRDILGLPSTQNTKFVKLTF